MDDKFSYEYILLSKPKKSDNSYVCSLYYKHKPEKPVIHMPASLIIGTKPLLQRNEYFVFIKNKAFNDLLFDINNHIVSIVKEKSPVWFNNNMNSELIDDMYTNTLVYDKTYGDIIRLKCIGNDESVLNDFKNKKVNLNITFNHLRIYKQKFVLECEITNCQSIGCEILCDDETPIVQTYEDELPSPTYEDVKKIKEEYNDIISAYLEDIKSKLWDCQQKMLGAQSLQDELLSTMNIDKISEIYTDFEKLCE